MLGRLWRYLKALFNRKMDNWEDPEILLDQARRDMQESHTRNREKAIQAITQKNNLQAMVDKEEQETRRLEKLAENALKQGNRELARTLLREKMTHEQTITQLRASLQQASTTVEQVKVAIQREDETIRRKTAEALALKARWKQAQIQNSIQKALSGLEFENTMQGFGAAEEKIRNMQSEAEARTEMYSTSMSGKIAALESQTVDVEADEELLKLEKQLGLTPAATQATEQQSVQLGGGDNDLDRQLRELEDRMGPSSKSPS